MYPIVVVNRVRSGDILYIVVAIMWVFLCVLLVVDQRRMSSVPMFPIAVNSFVRNFLALEPVYGRWVVVGVLLGVVLRSDFFMLDLNCAFGFK